MTNTKENLRKEMLCVANRIKQMRKEDLQSETANIIYNRLLIKKAVLAKQLKQMETPKIFNFIFKKIRRIKGQQLICDTF